MAVYYPRATVAIRYEKKTHLITPRSVKIERNSYRDPDQVTVQIDRGLEIDPRKAKRAAISVAIYNARYPLTNKTLNEWVHQQNRYQFIGRVDTAEVKYQKRKTTTLKARDHTAILIDNDWTGEELDLNHSLDSLIAQILLSTDATKTMKLQMHDGAPRLAQSRAPENQTFAAEANTPLWDIVQSLVAEAGMITWIDRNTLHVAKAQAYPGTGPVMRFGDNLKSLHMKQVNQRFTTRAITISSYDPSTKKTITSTWPPTNPGSEDTNAKPGKPFFYTVSGVTSQKQLDQVAKAVYERRVAQDIRVTAETCEMTAEILALASGSPFTIYGGIDERPTTYQVIKAHHTLNEQGYTMKAELANYINISKPKATDFPIEPPEFNLDEMPL